MSCFTRREELSRQVNSIGKERDEVKKQLRILESRISVRWGIFYAECIYLFSSPRHNPCLQSRPQSNGGPLESTPGVKKFFAALQPVWNGVTVARNSGISKFSQRTKGSRIRPIRTGRPVAQDTLRWPACLSGPWIRPPHVLLKRSPLGYRLLIANDSSLIERLICFAQVLDLLKKNGERAHKLAQDSSVALETYQKQVEVLEERNGVLAASIGAV